MGESSGCGSNSVATLLMLGNGNGAGGVLANGSLSSLGLIGNSSGVGMMKSESKIDYNSSLNRSPSSQSAGGHNGCHSPTSSAGSHPQYSAEYLAQLLKDKKQLGAFPNIFLHLERLVDDEINKVRISLFHLDTNKEALVLPDADGPVVTLQEKVYVPVKEYPDYNFVGRILGPRGMTAKQLEQETGCKVMVRGKGSMRDKKKEEQNRGKPNWEHLSDELHVLIQCEDSDNRAKIKLMRAVDEVKKLLVPAPEGEDELKRKQLMELAIINGTYRPANQSKIALQTPRLLTPMTLASPLRSPTLGAPIILSPTRIGAGAGTTPSSLTPNSFSAAGVHQSFMPSNADFAAAAAAGLLYNPLDPSLQAALAGSLSGCFPYSALSSPLLAAGDYGAFDTQAGAILNQRRILGQIRDHPYQRPSLKTPTL